MLAQALCEQGRFDDAEEFIQISQQSAPPNDVDANCRWKIAKALVLASRGDLGRSERLAREALALSEQTDDGRFQANFRVDLATILQKSQRVNEATDVLRIALRLYETKGDLVSAERVRERLRKLNDAGASEPSQDRHPSGATHRVGGPGTQSSGGSTPVG